MANALTGDFEAVLMIGTGSINRLLATLHQNGIDPDATPKCPHSMVLRVGGVNPEMDREMTVLHRWVAELQNTREVTLTKDNLLHYAGQIPAERTAALVKQFEKLTGILEKQKAYTVRGLAQVQCSPPVITIDDQTPFEFKLHVRVRVRYTADAESIRMPEWINGEIHAAYAVTFDGNAVKFTPSAHDEKYSFRPTDESDLAKHQVEIITREARRLLREAFHPMSVALPPDFAVSGFKMMRSGAHEAVALPLPVSPNPPLGDVDSILNSFIGASGFAIGISRQFASKTFAPMLDTIRRSVEAIRIPVDAFLFKTVYRGSFASGPTLTWHHGSLKLAGDIDLKTDSILPNQQMSFTQSFALQLDRVRQTFALVPLGEPTITATSYKERVTKEFKKVRDAALSGTGHSITSILRSSLDRFANALKSFDRSASASYTSVAIEPDGIVLHGSVGTAAPLNAVVVVQESPDGQVFSGYQSWIPGGFIERFNWSWGAGTFDVISGKSLALTVPEQNRFTISRAETIDSGLRGLSETRSQGICLSIDGYRLSPAGDRQSVRAGDSCGPHGKRANVPLPQGWYEWPFYPEKNYWEDDRGDRIIEDGIVSHGTWEMDISHDGLTGSNTLILFVDTRRGISPMQSIHRAAEDQALANAPLSVVLVLPAGTFAQTTRAELARKLDIAREKAAPLPSERSLHGKPHALVFPSFTITEDYDASWSRIFFRGSAQSGAAFLYNPRGELVWQSAEGDEPTVLAEALKRNLQPAHGPALVGRVLPLVGGTRMPNLRRVDRHGRAFELRQLRGRKVILLFWQPWSQPSLRELAHLQGMTREDHDVSLISVRCGAPSGAGELARADPSPNYTALHDVDGAIQRMFGLRSWPTTISVNELGFVDRVQIGMTRASRAAAQASS